MPARVATLSVGDAIIAGIAVLLAAYELWLYLVAGRRAEHAWLALVSASVAVFAATMAVHYNVDAEGGLWVTRLEALALIGVVNGTALFAIASTQRRPRGMDRFILFGAVLWTVLNFSPYSISAIELRPLYGLDHLFPRRVNTPLNDLGVLWGLGLSLWSAYWLLRHSRRGTRAIGYGIAMWLLAASVDALSPVVFDVMLPNLVHYGFLGLVTALVVRDVQHYLEMLRRGRRDFIAVMERTPDAVFVSSNDRIVWANGAAESLFGQSPLEGTASEALLQECDASVAVQELRNKLASERTVEFSMRRGNEVVAVEMLAVDVEYDGEAARVVVGRDVTHRQLDAARAMEMDRMITAGTLAAGIGHEISNPLAFALINVHEARDAIDLGSLGDARSLLVDAAEGLDRIEGVVRGLRSFARPDEISREVAVSRVVSSALAISGNEVSMRARLEVDVPPSLVVRGGETRLGQILTNLLINATHALPTGAPDQHRVRVSAERVGEAVLVQVSDTGCGMSPEVMERCFDPFFTTKPPEQGTGLGLSICRDLARELGGELVVESEVGGGTTFTVQLPAAKLEDTPQSVRRVRTPLPRRPHVLLVDDEIQLLRALARSLRRHADVVTVSSVAAALELLTEDPFFDLVLSDLVMPGKTGVDLHREVASTAPALAERFVFMTGGAFTDETKAFCDLHHDRVLIKPVNHEDILERLHQLQPLDPTPPVTRTAPGRGSSTRRRSTDRAPKKMSRSQPAPAH